MTEVILFGLIVCWHDLCGLHLSTDKEVPYNTVFITWCTIGRNLEYGKCIHRVHDNFLL